MPRLAASRIPLEALDDIIFLDDPVRASCAACVRTKHRNSARVRAQIPVTLLLVARVTPCENTIDRPGCRYRLRIERGTYK